ncbi:unnamed protein product [Thelazia callipaeda]|uniref:Ion_trans_2 domain-containing protein n=1 Tax=Thelazia callipaeda TaxID=103827 RepID=A0A0N5D8B9_THECL|nr:unnamed protein product [Thelazia callipaeda]
MTSLRQSLEDNLLSNSEISNITQIWRLINKTVIEIENCHRKKLSEIAPIEVFVFRNAILYSFGICTTIGYGNLHPRTVHGRILTVIYAVIGIPLNIAFISDLGQLISSTVKYAVQSFQKYIMNKTADDPWIEYKKFSSVVVIAVIMTPSLAIIVMNAERLRQWSYVDSLYYTFTTSTLIGLGDFTPQPSYVQFFFLMPLFFIAETVFALALGFITASFLALYTETESALAVRTDPNYYDARIAKLSAQKMLMNEKIDKEMHMLEAVPSKVHVGVLNAGMQG